MFPNPSCTMAVGRLFSAQVPNLSLGGNKPKLLTPFHSPTLPSKLNTDISWKYPLNIEPATCSILLGQSPF